MFDVNGSRLVNRDVQGNVNGWATRCPVRKAARSHTLSPRRGRVTRSRSRPGPPCEQTVQPLGRPRAVTGIYRYARVGTCRGGEGQPSPLHVSAGVAPNVSCTPPAPSCPSSPAKSQAPRSRTRTRSRPFPVSMKTQLRQVRGPKRGRDSLHLHPEQPRHRAVVRDGEDAAAPGSVFADG